MGGPFQTELRLDVDATNYRQGIFSVQSSVLCGQTQVRALRLPKWLPAYHAPRGPIKSVAGLAVFADGAPVRWLRDPGDLFRFVLEIHGPVSELGWHHQFLTPTEPAQGRVLAGPAMLRVQWDGLCLYPDGFDDERIGVRARVKYPPAWHSATALETEAREGSTVFYLLTSLDKLVDSPVVAGAHHARFTLGRGVTLDTFADRPEQLPQDDRQIELHANLVAEADALFGRRPFRNYTFLLCLSDWLGRMGLEHRASSENGVRADYFSDWDNSITERDLLPHEYVHSWIGKYRVPRGNLNSRFDQRMTNELMWVYEGLTQYYGHVLAARSGLISADQTLGAFAQIAATYDARPGRRWRSLADTVHDPIFAAREPLAWKSWQRSEDYYSEGLLLWLEADMTIRRQSGGAKSLDDFAKWFFSPSCETESSSPYDRGALIDALHQILPFDWTRFFRMRVDEIAQHAPLAGLTTGGYELVWRSTPNDWARCDQHHNEYLDLEFSLGLKIGLAHRILEVIWGSLAFAAELAVGATILRVNDQDYTHDRMKQAVSSAGSDGAAIRLLVRQQDVERGVELRCSGGHSFPTVKQVAEQPLLRDALQPRRNMLSGKNL